MSEALPVAHVALAVVGGVALIGFAVGIARPPAEAPALVVASAEADASAYPEAPTYRGLRAAPFADGAGFATDTRTWRGPSVLDPVLLDGTSKPADLADRADHRAYDGAPPTIPHAIHEGGAAECLACHDDGLRLRGRVARPVPHAAYASCTQCHVVESAAMPGPRLADVAEAAPSGFVGIASPTGGPRAWDGAPPLIPHRTLMRERCLACHGPGGRDAFKSTHPERQSCTQCHASSAELDLRPGLADAGTGRADPGGHARGGEPGP